MHLDRLRFLSSYSLVGIVLLVLVFADVSFGRTEIHARQNDGGDASGTSVALTTRTRLTTDQPTAAPSSSSGDEIRPTSSTNSAAVESSTPSMIPDENWLRSDRNGTAVYNGVGLPIMPTITPGIAVAGVLLMLTGLPYCLIGIKKKKVQIFLSTGYLCSLGVTVLIIYVMNPPVKDAIQGAYVVAATLTGAFFGAVAVVFPEVTETLACLLGGFCLSMWFLALKPGGLLPSTFGKLILMAAFSIVAFALAFHRITKPYAIIVSTAFSGATAIVLGIDCFANSGYKEFWLYIWDLNDKIFPLQTNTYPHTRGMRVEIAIILLITAFGIMSQMKLWKILKERREQKRAARLRAEGDVERLNEEVGKRVEEQDKEERAKWEKIYGNAVDEDGTVRESRPTTAHASSDSKVTLTEEEGQRRSKDIEHFVETEEMKKERDQYIQAAKPEDEQNSKEKETVQGEGEKPQDGTQSVVVTDENKRLSGQSIAGGVPLAETENQAEIPPETAINTAPPPVPILMRQHVPYIPDEKDCDEDVMSLATCADTIPGTITLEESKEDGVEVTVDQIEAAERMDGDQEPSILPSTADNEQIGEIPRIKRSRGSTGEKANEIGRDDASSEEEKTGDEVVAAESVRRSTKEVEGNTESCGSSGHTRKLKAAEDKGASVTSCGVSQCTPVSMADFSALQNHCSRIHKTYRTNEWAKHLADAEALELDDLSSSPPVDEGIPEEIPVPVLIAELQQDAIPELRSQPPARSVSGLSPEPPQDSLVPQTQTPLSFAVSAVAHVPPPPIEATQSPQAQSTLGFTAKSTASPAPPPSPTSSTPPPPMIATRPENKSATPPGHATSISPATFTTSPYTPAPTPSPPPPTATPPISLKPALRTNSIPTIPENRVIAPRVASPTVPRAATPMPQIPYEDTLMGKRESMLKFKPSVVGNEQHMINRAASPNMMRAASPIGIIRSATPNGIYTTADHPSILSLNRRLSNQDDMTLAERRELLQLQQQQQAALQQQQQTPSPQLTPRNSYTMAPPSPTAAAKQDQLLQSWRKSLKQDAQISQHQQPLQTQKAEKVALEVLNEKQRAANLIKEKELERLQRNSIMEERMRRPDMLNAHREAMRKLQASAST